MKLLLENVWPEDRLRVRGFERPRGVIYGLVDPVEGEVRYIGYAHDPKKRLNGHISSTIKGDHHPGKWLRKLQRQGLKPVMVILQHCYGSDAVLEAAEECWIECWRASERTAGHTVSRLTNHHRGGRGGRLLEGPSGDITREKLQRAKRSDKHRQHLRAMNADSEVQEKKRKHLKALQTNPDMQEKRLQHLKTTLTNPAYREKNRQHLANLHASPEHQKHLKALHTSPENREKIRQAAKARYTNPEYREKNRQQLQARNASPGHREKRRQSMNALWSAVRAAGCKTLAEYKALQPH